MRAALLALLLLLPADSAAPRPRKKFSQLMRAAITNRPQRWARRRTTAPGYAIAARAVLADDVLRDKPCLGMSGTRRTGYHARRWRPIRAMPSARSGWRCRWAISRASHGIVKARLRDARPVQNQR